MNETKEMRTPGSDPARTETSSAGIVRKERSAGKLDRRTRRTRAALGRALIQLLQKKPLQSITITELTNLADVNRATFYLHYHDVYDIYEQVKQEIYLSCRALVDDHRAELENHDFSGFLADVLTLAKNDKDVFNVVLGCNTDRSLFYDISNVIHDCLLTAARSINGIAVDQPTQEGASAESRKDGEESPTGEDRTTQEEQDMRGVILDYQFDYIASGATAVLKHWLEGGCKQDIAFMTALGESFIERADPEAVYERMKAAGR